MAFAHNEDVGTTQKKIQSEATSALQRVNRLIDNSDTEGSQFKDIINELRFLKTQIAASHDVSTMHRINNVRMNISKDSILIANIDDALCRAENIVKQHNSERILFNGNPAEWYRFLETFQKTVHSRSDLTDVSKFECLKKMVEGLPLETIKELPLIDSSYMKALELLKLAFKNKKVLIEAHLHSLCDMESPISLPESLSKFRLEYEYHIKALKNYESNFENSSGFVIAELLKRKLPKELQARISKKNENNYWTLRNFQDAVNSEIEFLSGYKYGKRMLQPSLKSNSQPSLKSNSNGQNIVPPLIYETQEEDLRNFLLRSRASKVKKEQKRENKERKKNRNNYRKKLRRKSFRKQTKKTLKEITSSFGEVRGLFPCTFCESAHFVPSCTIYNTPLKRRRRAAELHLCLRCLDDSHTIRQCNVPLKCKYCTGRHVPSMCFQINRRRKLDVKSIIRNKKKFNAKSHSQLPNQTQKD